MDSSVPFTVIPGIPLPQANLVEVNEGDTTVFTCSATGIPAPEITWLKEGRPFDQDYDSRVTLNTPNITEPNTIADLYLVHRTLTLIDTKDADSGNYTCVAENKNEVQPNVTFCFELFVRGRTFSLAHLFTLVYIASYRSLFPTQCIFNSSHLICKLVLNCEIQGILM